jgi:hypothetical protein
METDLKLTIYLRGLHQLHLLEEQLDGGTANGIDGCNYTEIYL